MTKAEARFNNSLRPRKPEGSLGRTAQDVHLDSHTAPELWEKVRQLMAGLLVAGADRASEKTAPVNATVRLNSWSFNPRLERIAHFIKKYIYIYIYI